MIESIIMPKAGMAMETGVVTLWHKQVGDTVSKGDVLLEIETDKVTMELEAEADGTLLKIVHGDGTTVPVTHVIGWIGDPGEEIPEPAEPEIVVASEAGNESAGSPAASPSTTSTPAAAAVEGRIAATPAARRLAAERGIDLATVAPTGKHGEIRERDVAKIQPIKATPLARKLAAARGIALRDVTGSGVNGKIRSKDIPDRAPRQPMSGMRKIIAARMLQSHQEIPSATLYTEVDVTELVDLRKALNETAASKISFNDMVIKASALALKAHPIINASLDGNDILFHSQINIGMAVAVDDGLMVPVLNNVDELMLEEVAKATKSLAERARSNRLMPDELSGGTFTVTNLGMFGIKVFTPIINQPELAILGVGAIEDRLALENGTVVVRKLMGLSLTHDHRVVDGALAAQFLNTIGGLLTNPKPLKD